MVMSEPASAAQSSREAALAEQRGIAGSLQVEKTGCLELLRKKTMLEDPRFDQRRAVVGHSAA